MTPGPQNGFGVFFFLFIFFDAKMAFLLGVLRILDVQKMVFAW
jgi:hypothetical protein